MLHHEILGAGRRVCWVLHGLLGCAANWRGFLQQRVVPRAVGWTFVVPDLRMHANSMAGFPAPHTIHAAAADVARLSSELRMPIDAVCAHSLGGKIALRLLEGMRPVGAWGQSDWALPQPSTPLRAVILDSVPGTWDQLGSDSDRDSITKVLTFLRGVTLPVRDRRGLRDSFNAAGFSPTLTAWMLSNLKHAGGGPLESPGQAGAPSTLPATPRRWTPDTPYTWRFDVDAASQLLHSHVTSDLWGVLFGPPPALCSMDFVVASRSSRWHDAENGAKLAALRQHKGVVHVRDVDAGHWVHVDAPDVVADLLLAQLHAHDPPSSPT